jgi:hypothetical protein
VTGELTLYGRSTASVFDLLGRDEVDLTAALGWTLTRSPALLGTLWERLGMPGEPDAVGAALEVADDLGRTDLELTGVDARVVIEAKKGWLVPGEVQLSKYLGRFDAFGSRLLVSLSDSSAAWARHQLPEHVGGVPVRHVPWDDIRVDVRAARQASKSAERLWLDELSNYLMGATAVRDVADQWAYCVVVSGASPATGGRTFREFVIKERIYFHPYGGRNGWPKRPPRFMAFRWGGRVRQINRVVAHEVVPHLNDRLPGIPRGMDGADHPHIIYSLGPDIPIPVIPTKGVYPNGRVWALLDQILTQPTLGDAVRESKKLTRGNADSE